MSQAYFIAGTDTDVGKTTIAAGLLHAARQHGLSTLAAKPVASGCAVTPKGLRNSDALALMAPRRAAMLPNTPTMAEGGFADLNLSAWVGLFAPAKTPQPVIDKLNRAVRVALDSEIKTKLGENGMEVAPSTPEQLRQTVAQDIKLHAELVKAAGIQPQ